MSVRFEDVREKFEFWAKEQGFNLTRHPNDDDFYYHRDVSMLWVCFNHAYALGSEDQMDSLTDELTSMFDDDEPITEQIAFIEKMTNLDD